MKMQIHETEITTKQLEACLTRMKAAPFRASDIAKIAIENGVPESIGREYIACRVADRLIQRQRKLGKIKATSPNPMWLYVA